MLLIKCTCVLRRHKNLSRLINELLHCKIERRRCLIKIEIPDWNCKSSGGADKYTLKKIRQAHRRKCSHKERAGNWGSTPAAVSTENADLFDYRIFGIVLLAFVRTSVFPEFRQFKIFVGSSAMPATSYYSGFFSISSSLSYLSQLFFLISHSRHLITPRYLFRAFSFSFLFILRCRQCILLVPSFLFDPTVLHRHTGYCSCLSASSFVSVKSDGWLCFFVEINELVSFIYIYSYLYFF